MSLAALTVRLRRNLHGPYKNAAEMIEDCLAEDDI
ncbi:MAG: hypothetical protein Ta2F_17260 [Termitinemataceae bacterium]|nr:MAG: hypothetical protein Ta2F_17260 [Termitinemataceae bacterium]